MHSATGISDERARSLLASQRKGLERAIEVFSRDRLDICSLNHARNMLAKVCEWQGRIETDAPFILGNMGPNGHGPAIDLIIRDAEKAGGSSDINQASRANRRAAA